MGIITDTKINWMWLKLYWSSSGLWRHATWQVVARVLEETSALYLNMGPADSSETVAVAYDIIEYCNPKDYRLFIDHSETSDLMTRLILPL